jgi:hypothetical protein
VKCGHRAFSMFRPSPIGNKSFRTFTIYTDGTGDYGSSTYTNATLKLLQGACVDCGSRALSSASPRATGSEDRCAAVPSDDIATTGPSAVGFKGVFLVIWMQDAPVQLKRTPIAIIVYGTMRGDF